MRLVTCFCALFFSVTSCNNSNEVQQEELSSTVPLPTSMKGYELYSWQQDGHWNFTLITGTNRNKTYEEIVSQEHIENNEWVKITVQNTGDLKNILKRLPEREHIIWVSNDVRVSGFSLPPSPITQEIEAISNTLKLNLTIA